MIVRKPDAIDAATTVAQRLSLAFDDTELVADDPNGIVRLLPSPLVARVTRVDTLLRGPESIENALAVAAHAASRGAPVTPPAADVSPGPHEHDGAFVSLWQWIPSGGKRDPGAAGKALRRVHEALADFRHGRLPPYHLDEIKRLIEQATPNDAVTAADLAFVRARVEALAAIVAPLLRQAIHGDAHLGNVVWSPEGPVWADWEMTCSGPVELDLAALVIRERTVGPTASVAEALAGYGAHDRALVESLVPMFALMTTAWMIRVHEVSKTRVPADALRSRMAWWRRQ